MKLNVYHFLKSDDDHTNCMSNLNLKKALCMSPDNFSKVLGPLNPKRWSYAQYR